MEFKIPEEVWSDKEAKFSHLKVFGCISYVHIDSDAYSKLDAKSKICLFYFILLAMVKRNLAINFERNKTEKSLEAENVIFNELTMYKDKSIVVPDLTEID